MVLMCDFSGFVAPEMVKTRPVAVISPNHMRRPGLVTVVPLSTTPPEPILEYHYCLKGSPIPGDSSIVWAKCDMVVTVRLERLERIRLARGKYETGHISMEQIREIRLKASYSLGVDLGASNPQTVT